MAHVPSSLQEKKIRNFVARSTRSRSHAFSSRKKPFGITLESCELSFRGTARATGRGAASSTELAQKSQLSKKRAFWSRFFPSRRAIEHLTTSVSSPRESLSSPRTTAYYIFGYQQVPSRRQATTAMCQLLR